MAGCCRPYSTYDAWQLVRRHSLLVFSLRESVPLLLAKSTSQEQPQKLNSNPIFATTALSSQLRFLDLMSNRRLQEFRVASSCVFWLSFFFLPNHNPIRPRSVDG